VSDCHPAALPTERLLGECRIWRQRRSGPGGQHRNKVETAVIIEHVPTGIRGEASERRSQEQNRRVAVFRLRIQLAIHVRSWITAVESYDASPLWKTRRTGNCLSVSPRHDDFPAVLAEALDVTAASNFHLPTAARVLGTTTSQLLKFLADEPAALALVNAQRHQQGRRPYLA
jgi:hypothetical protein